MAAFHKRAGNYDFVYVPHGLPLDNHDVVAYSQFATPLVRRAAGALGVRRAIVKPADVCPPNTMIAESSPGSVALAPKRILDTLWRIFNGESLPAGAAPLDEYIVVGGMPADLAQGTQNSYRAFEPLNERDVTIVRQALKLPPADQGPLYAYAWDAETYDVKGFRGEVYARYQR
jgi:hypothetical protein